MKPLLQKSRLALVLILSFWAAPAVAQDTVITADPAPAPVAVPVQAPVPAPSTFETKALAANEVTLSAGNRLIRLWGIDAIDAGGAKFRMEARTALDNQIGNAAIQCDVKGNSATAVLAQCVNDADTDLGLFMLQKGYVMADRASVYGSAYEEPYINAERQAQQKSLGIWSEDTSKGSSIDGARTLLIGAFVLLMLFIASFVFLAFVMMRGFKNFMASQERSNDFMHKEREIKNQERKLVASLLDAELRGNKSKIEAYMMIYGELLKSIQDPNKAPSYKKTGDIVQMQPVMDRVVFDRNTDKMDLLGRRLASEIIHFYARIKTNPDYVNLEPETSLEDAKALVEKALAGASRLDTLLQSILDSFAKAGLTQDD